MIALLTSCGRQDLLNKTIDSFFHDQEYEDAEIFIHEDGVKNIEISSKHRGQTKLFHTRGIGQHLSIQRFLESDKAIDKYYIHLEDDWFFENSYDWIRESVKIMESNPDIIKVLCRFDSPHPCIHDDKNGYGLLGPWENKGIVWNGFSWNPGVTRMDLLKNFMPFGKYEQDVAKDIYNAGYKVAELIKPIYKHIGDGRSTHE